LARDKAPACWWHAYYSDAKGQSVTQVLEAIGCGRCPDTLDDDRRRAIEREFWEAGRLTLEWWLTPRLAGDRFHRWPRNSVVSVQTEPEGPVRVALASHDTLTVDRIILATGYKADLTRVDYLTGVMPEIRIEDGFPALDEAFQSSVEGLYFPGFSATRDFGPFFGFTKGCPAAATLIVEDLCR